MKRARILHILVLCLFAGLVLLPAANVWANNIPFRVGAADITIEVLPLGLNTTLGVDTFKWSYVLTNNLPAENPPGTANPDGIEDFSLTVNKTYIVDGSVGIIDNSGEEPNSTGAYLVLNGQALISWQWNAQTFTTGEESWILCYEATVGATLDNGQARAATFASVLNGGFDGVQDLPGAGDNVASRAAATVPEPATLLLLGAGLLTLGGLRRRYNK